MKRIIILTIISFSLIFLSVFGSSIFRTSELLIKGDPLLKDNTKVIFHFSSQIDPRASSIRKMKEDGFAQIHYYDKKGEDIGSFSVNREVIKDFMVETPNSIAYLFNNFTLVVDENKKYVMQSDSKIKISRTQFGPNKVGYIDKRNYSIKYNNELYNDEVVEFAFIFVQDNIVYQIFATPPYEKVKEIYDAAKNEDEILSVGNDNAVLGLRKINIDSQKIELLASISQGYKRTGKGIPFLSGSSHMPLSENNGKMYAFLSSYKLFIIQDEEKIKKMNFKFDFDDVISKWKPYANEKNSASSDFFDSVVKIEDDGKVYIANLHKDGKLRIHVLNNNGMFEIFWESKEKIPKLKRGNMQINDFEIINLGDI